MNRAAELTERCSLPIIWGRLEPNMKWNWKYTSLWQESQPNRERERNRGRKEKEREWGGVGRKEFTDPVTEKSGDRSGSGMVWYRGSNDAISFSLSLSTSFLLGSTFDEVVHFLICSHHDSDWHDGCQSPNFYFIQLVTLAEIRTSLLPILSTNVPELILKDLI